MSSPPEHPQHALGDEEAARDVDRREQNGDGAENHRRRARGAGELEESAHEDDAADRIGDAHERRVERGRDVPNDLPANETGEDEHREMGDEARRHERACNGEEQREEQYACR